MWKSQISHHTEEIFTKKKPGKLKGGKTEGRKNTFVVLHCRYCNESKLMANLWSIPWGNQKNAGLCLISQSLKGYQVNWARRDQNWEQFISGSQSCGVVQAAVQETLHGHVSHSTSACLTVSLLFLSLMSCLCHSELFLDSTVRWEQTAAVAAGSHLFTHTHRHTHTQVNIHVLMPLLSLNQLGRCFVKHVCATAAWSGRACVCTHMCGCVYIWHSILPDNQNEIWSSGLLRVGRATLLLPCGGIFKTVAHPQPSALCSGSSAPLGLSPTPCCAYWNLGSQLSYRPIRKPFTKATANWISAPFPFQMRV